MLTFDTMADARAHLKDMYDSAQSDVPAVVKRSDDPAVAMVRLDSLKRLLRGSCPINPEVRFGGQSVSVWLPGLPISSQGTEFDSAVVEFVAALRDYAQTWVEDLRGYPNHAENWGLVNLIQLSSDAELVQHAFGED
jgi:hypothetical protein